MEFNKTKPIALGIAFTLALTPIHAITYADTNSDSASINVQTAQTEYKSGFVFTKSSYAYRKGADLTVCVSKSNLSVACDSYKLFYISDGSEQAIDRNSYTIRVLGDAVYFTLSTNWLSQYSPQDIDITAIAYNGTAEVSKTNAKLVSEDGFDIDFAAGTVCVNQTENIRTNGQGELTQDARSQAGGKKYIYVVDSVISQDESIIKISNAGNEWKYTGMKPGKTKLTVRYHYYYGKEKCTGEKTAEYEVVPATYTLDEERGSSGMLINRGASYTCNLRTKQTTYDKSGKAVSKYVDNVAYEWYISEKEENVAVNIEQTAQNKLKITPANASESGAFCIGIRALDASGNVYFEEESIWYLVTDGQADGDHGDSSETANPGNTSSGSQNTNTGSEKVSVSKSQSISLLENHNIGLNIYWKMTGSTYDIGDCMVKYTYEGDSGTPHYVALNRSPVGDGESYCSRIDISAVEMTEKVNLQLLSNSGKVLDTFSTSVEDYAKSLLASNTKEYAAYKPVVKAMLNYGAASQQYFGFMTYALANRSLTNADKTIQQIPQATLKQYAANSSIRQFSMSGIHYYGSSLVAGDDVKLRHYFKLDSGRDISNYSFATYVGGDMIGYATPCRSKDKDMYYIEVTCTNRNFFSGMRTIVSNGNTETILDYQPMNYIAKAYGSSKLTSELKTLLDAMYWFEYQKIK